MKYTIECSFGEIIDKITILEIKLKKSCDELQKRNILKEYDSLKNHLEGKNEDFNKLYKQLTIINNKLWILEDIVREKSGKKEFDLKYIECAENIHITNDERYQVKKKLNELYDSDIIEYKLYSQKKETTLNVDNKQISQKTPISIEDNNLFMKSMSLVENGNYVDSNIILKKLCKKYFNSNDKNELIGKIFFSYNITAIKNGTENIYASKMKGIIENYSEYFSSIIDIMHATRLYGIHLLDEKKYLSCEKYIIYMQPCIYEEANIIPENMSYFKPNDKNKNILVYMSGGIGDKVMHSRFIKLICELEIKNNNTILFLVDPCLYWIFSQIYKDIPNCIVYNFGGKNLIPKYDYHMNIMMCFSYLKITYKDIFIDYFLENVLSNTAFSLQNIIVKGKKNIIINWCGNKNNQNEKYCRGMSLNDLIPLLKNKDINWISVQKDASNEEKMLLKKYGVKDIGSIIDKDGEAFKDTLFLLKHIDLVISTDTSLVHVSGTANINTWCLLTVGCDWRWTLNESNTNWYPNMKLFRQLKIGDWTNVVNDIKNELKLMQRA